MTIDITAEMQPCETIFRITTAGADPHSVVLVICQYDETADDWQETEILLSRAEALLAAKSIRHYFKHTIPLTDE